ncbi:toxin-antitoxin system YwqK family antitoxin [Sphingobacterium spiritivorum]|uniref:toxin-antitoxin system YwqK family antitoxin n=1 Tax=Sphingobacterium spiritivorum TaxID=258 RepID=UPI003DA3D8D7
MKISVYLTLLSLSLVFSSGAQKRQEVQYNRFTINGEDGSKQTFFAEDKRINSKSDRLYSWYASNKITLTEGGFSGKLLNGEYTRYYPNKNLAEKGIFKFGLRNGLWRSWSSEGLLTKESNWIEGIETGAFVQYNSDGKQEKKGELKNGKLHGAIQLFSGSDSTSVQYYNEGKSISEEEYINSNLFRKSGSYLGRTFGKLFNKNKEPKQK